MTPEIRVHSCDLWAVPMFGKDLFFRALWRPLPLTLFAVLPAAGQPLPSVVAVKISNVWKRIFQPLEHPRLSSVQKFQCLEKVERELRVRFPIFGNLFSRLFASVRGLEC